MYDENTATTYVKRRREKIEDNKKDPIFIKSIRAIEYIFDEEIIKRKYK